MHKIFPALSLSLLFLSVVSIFGNSNSRVPWQYYETEHFKIIFHADVKPQADLARDFLETAYSRIRADLGVEDKGIQISVVLTGLPDESNGLSTPLGHHIILYTRPMQVIASGDIAWLKRVLAHELTHQLTFLALRKSFWGIYSELYKTLHLPAWFIEGVAQYEAEAWDAKRNTFFAHALYNSALEAYPDLATYTKNDPVSGRLVYEQGHAFVRFLVHRQGKGFLGPLLKRITVIPVWSEFMALLSPFTSSVLPFESALRAKTGKGIRALYQEFLYGMKIGLPPGLQPPKPLLGGIPGFDAVYQVKTLGPASFVFTGQRDWDQPFISLFLFKNGQVKKIDPDFVNPVFDLSPDGHRVLFVRDYLNSYGDPVQKLFLRDLRSGTASFLSDGAAHPIFLGNDSMAFSHYRNGLQKLTLCTIKLPVPTCSEAPTDSLVGFYALSRSSQGILGNATDAKGRTRVFQYSPGMGFTSPISDSGLSEFPVEAGNGTILVLRERLGLLQVEAWNRYTGYFVPVTGYSLGTFYLHKMSQDKIASISQTGTPGKWNLMPVEVMLPIFDSVVHFDSVVNADAVQTLDSAVLQTADTLAVDSSKTFKPEPIVENYPGYRAPEFLKSPLPSFDERPAANPEPLTKEYHSPLEMQPLIAWPAVYDDFPGVGFGGGMLLEDPLQLHTLTFSIAGIRNGPGYNVDYVNRQLPVEFVLSGSNLDLNVLKFLPPAGWKSVYLVTRTSEYSLQLNIPMPLDIPLPHSFFLGLMVRGLIHNYALAGALDSGQVNRLNSWSSQTKEFRPQIFLAYACMLPYAYSHVHPLQFTDLQLGYEKAYSDNVNLVYWFARQTLPIHHEATFTLWYYGQWQRPKFHETISVLPDGNTLSSMRGWDRGYDQNLYTSVDFPFRKGYWFELPLLGPLNYLGGSIFGGFGREAYLELPNIPGSGYRLDRKTAGGKLVFLFHPLRRFPLSLSQSAQYDFVGEEMKYLTQVEFAGLPGSLDLFPDGRKWRHGGHRPP